MKEKIRGTQEDVTRPVLGAGGHFDAGSSATERMQILGFWSGRVYSKRARSSANELIQASMNRPFNSKAGIYVCSEL